MVRALIAIVILTVLLGYLVMFMSWNAELADITVLQVSGTAYVQELHVGLLLLVGVLIGVGAMFGALRTPWSRLKDESDQLRALVDKAKTKLKSQDKKIKSLTAKLEKSTEAAAEVAAARVPDDVADAVDAVDSAPAAPEPPPPADAGPESDKKATEDNAEKVDPTDDPEVI